MSKLTFQTLTFALEKERLIVHLLKIFSTKIPLEELKQISSFRLINEHTLDFPQLGQEKAEQKFSFLLAKHFHHLVNDTNHNRAVYIHRQSGIPLIGHVGMGIVYRNSSLIEIKPITSCNLNCIYCSISEGRFSQKVDFVVEKDYLVEELQKLLDFVAEPVEIHIGVQGEPFLYADLLPLIADLENNLKIKKISMDTNFTLVTKSMIDQLAFFKKLQLNISLDALNPQLAEKMAGGSYHLAHVLKMIKFAAKKKIHLLVAPVYLPGYNEEELEKIINFVKRLKINSRLQLGIQNFLNYKTGRNPVKAITWKKFYALMENLEKKTGVKLRLKPEDFGIHPTKELPKPFQEGDLVKAVLKCPDRFPHTSLAVAKNRTISIVNSVFQQEKEAKVKIIRDKHNIFVGKIV